MSTIQSLASALASNDKARVVRLVDDLVASNQDRRQTETRTAQLARAIAQGLDDGSPDFDAVATYGETHAKVMEARKSLDRVLIDYIDGDATASEAASAVETLIDREAALDDAATAIDALTDTVTVPPTLALDRLPSREVPKGTTIDLTTTARNLGDTAIDDVTVTLDIATDLTATPSTITSLPKGQETEITVSGTAATSGQFQGQLAIETETLSDSTLFAIATLTKRDYLQRALQQTQDLHDTLQSFDLTQPAATDGGPGGSNAGGPGGGTGGPGAAGLANKLDTIERRLEQLVEQVENGQPPVNAFDNEIEGVHNTYGAFRNQVEGMAGDQLTPFQSALLDEDARRAQETLERALEAET